MSEQDRVNLAIAEARRLNYTSCPTAAEIEEIRWNLRLGSTIRSAAWSVFAADPDCCFD